MEAEHINSISTSSTIWRSAPPSCGGIFDYDQKRESALTLLTQEMEDPKIWDDAKRAQELGREKKRWKTLCWCWKKSRPASTMASELFDMRKDDGRRRDAALRRVR